MNRMRQYRALWIGALAFFHPLLAAAQQSQGGEQQRTIDAVTAITVILIASFAIERVVTGFLTFLSLFQPLAGVFRSPNSPENSATTVISKTQRAVYFILAGALSALVIVGLKGAGVFSRLGVMGVEKTDTIGHGLDIILTWLILVAGSDRIAELLKKMGAAAAGKGKPEPLEITGKVLMVDEAAEARQAAEAPLAKTATRHGS